MQVQSGTNTLLDVALSPYLLIPPQGQSQSSVSSGIRSRISVEGVPKELKPQPVL